MYVEKKTIPTLVSSNTTKSINVVRQGHRSLNEFGAARKLPALSSIGPPNDHGDEIGTILDKLAFLQGTQSVSGIKD